MLTEVVREAFDERSRGSCVKVRGSRWGQFALRPAQPSVQSGTDLHGGNCSTLCGGDSLFLVEKNPTQPVKQTSQIFAVFHTSAGCHATRSTCPGVLLSSAMGVAAKLRTQQNPKKVSLPLPLSAVCLYTCNDHHFTLESCVMAPYMNAYNNTVK